MSESSTFYIRDSHSSLFLQSIFSCNTLGKSCHLGLFLSGFRTWGVRWRRVFPYTQTHMSGIRAHGGLYLPMRIVSYPGNVTLQ